MGTTRVRISAGAKRFFSFPICPDRLCGPYSPLFNGHWS